LDPKSGRQTLPDHSPDSDTSLLDRSSSSSFFDPPVEDIEVVKNRRFNHSSIKIEVNKKKKKKKNDGQGFAIQHKVSEISNTFGDFGQFNKATS
jgi:hypothetical protein